MEKGGSMTGVQRYERLLKLKTGSPEQLIELAWAIPLLFRFREQIIDEKSFYHAEFPNFKHQFCGGYEFKLVVGKILELWDGGTYRDGEFFFFGGTGNMDSCVINGVNIVTGACCQADVGPLGMLNAEESIKRLRVYPELDLEPGRHSMPLGICMLSMEGMAQGEEQAYQIPEVVPAFMRRMGKVGRMPQMPALDFVTIPAGEFLMGKANKPLCRSQKVSAGVPVKVPSFELMPVPVSREIWQTVTGETPAGSGNAKAALTHVSWHDCEAFCRMLTGMDREYSYSLPTEAQWEYACRAGSDTDFIWGDNPESPDAEAFLYKGTLEDPAPVGDGKPNKWGIHDMWSGPSEWCLDRYLSPTAAVAGLRNIRGGSDGLPLPSWFSEGMAPWYQDSICGVTHRFGLGFRLVRTRKV